MSTIATREMPDQGDLEGSGTWKGQEEIYKYSRISSGAMLLNRLRNRSDGNGAVPILYQ
jgi:hypothetical protein